VSFLKSKLQFSYSKCGTPFGWLTSSDFAKIFGIEKLVSIACGSMQWKKENTEEARMEYKKSRQNAKRVIFSAKEKKQKE